MDRPASPFAPLRLPFGLVTARSVPASSAEALALADPFSREEKEHLAALSPGRQPTWVAGRLALRGGLEAYGHVPSIALLANDRGAPVVPPGFRASISHKRQLAVALVTPVTGDRPAAVGIDLEELRRPRSDLSVRILTPAERARLPHVEEARWKALLLHFSVKEAVYKAVDPFVRRFVSFQEVEVEVADDPKCDYGEARVAFGDCFGENTFHVEALWVRGEDHILAAARVQTQRDSTSTTTGSDGCAVGNRV